MRVRARGAARLVGCSVVSARRVAGERRALEEKKHAEEVQFLKRTNAQLKKELETYLSPTKK